ncbi:uncharacterized protein BDZ99DRAFT_521300 [Mytilinidion resinicola]|uniref:Uncharacterized protein n=1 Tax=Mytilinidion resinicola TaxID=574789 RepID=A0A6A6YJT1_9PEZI|nr:uncharacterized protein BDZ99DRAFT_521300 [Mytilinidion resinicola]KAF2808819.1 hypothetical protein BDZ99DRAFT_521300 [Mytilinidion resinicola]
MRRRLIPHGPHHLLENFDAHRALLCYDCAWCREPGLPLGVIVGGICLYRHLCLSTSLSSIILEQRLHCPFEVFDWYKTVCVCMSGSQNLGQAEKYPGQDVPREGNLGYLAKRYITEKGLANSLAMAVHEDPPLGQQVRWLVASEQFAEVEGIARRAANNSPTPRKSRVAEPTMEPDWKDSC